MNRNVYESERALSEYLLFHYGSPRETLTVANGPTDALNFQSRVVGEVLLARICPDRQETAAPSCRALDIGCSVGRTCFELSKFCDEVLGIDLSQSFIRAADTIRTEGELPFMRREEGRVETQLVARRPAHACPEKVSFRVADALDLPTSLGMFDVIVAANLICRLPDPEKFLRAVPALAAPTGHLLITTPSTWLGEFTPPEKWPPGRTLPWLQEILEPEFNLVDTRDLPFLIRETARKFQWSVAQATLWQKKERETQHAAQDRP